MIRPAALAALLALAGCSAEPRASGTFDGAGSTGPAEGFDAAAWLTRARPFADAVAEYDTTSEVPLESDEAYDQRHTSAKRHSAELDAAVGWGRACDTYWDSEAQREAYEPTEPGGGHGLRGTYTVHDVGPAEHVVVVTCDFGAYQGSHALVHIDGRRATLLRSPNIATNGKPAGPPDAVYSDVSFRAGTREFETFGKARGLADCGMISTYRVADFGEAAVKEVRARDCDDRPEDAPSPDQWPVVYPRP